MGLSFGEGAIIVVGPRERQTARPGIRRLVIRLVHLTDPHLTRLDGESLRTLSGKRWTGYLSWQRHRRHVHRPEVLARLTEAVHGESADQIVVTGDLVQIGLPAEIEAAAGWLAQLGPPRQVMLVPGNHDAYAADSWDAVARAWAPYLGIGSDGNGQLPDPPGTGRVADAASHAGFPVRRDLAVGGTRVVLFGLSSARPSGPFMADGSLGAGQLHRLEQGLGEVEGFRCLLLHHPPLTGMTSRRKSLRDAPALEALLHRQRADLVLHGHVHRNLDYQGPAAVRVFGTASASSAGGRGQSAYRCFDIEPDGAGWAVSMRLLEVSETGPREIGQARWRTPFSPASLPAGA